MGRAVSRQDREPGPSLEGLAGAVLGVTVVYLAAEAALPGNRHPLHWLITIVGGAAGYAIGHAVYLVKERRAWRVPRQGRGHERRPPSTTTRRPHRRRR